MLSLDFELHWGVRDHQAIDGPYAANLHGARAAVPALLRTFADYAVACTWATVGFLFARDREELRAWQPRRRPSYADPRLDPYGQAVGADEASDPLHYAPSLIAQVMATPRQELATHTHSHYYCLDDGGDAAVFAADLAAARTAAAARGAVLRSIVYPRNQRNPAYDAVLREAGIVAYRGNPRGVVHRERNGAETRLHHRLARAADAYAPVGPSYLQAWDDVRQPSGLCDVAASFFLRPLEPALRPLEPLRMTRLRAAIRRAAESGRLVHLWWHPHNFGVRLEEHLAMLRELLDTFAACREREGMLSLSMAEVADRVTAAGQAAA